MPEAHTAGRVAATPALLPAVSDGAAAETAIERKDLETGLDAIERLYARNRSTVTAGRFRWLYEDGPHGPARIWLAHHRDRAEPVGAVAAFPRQVRFPGGTTRTAWLCGDLSVHKEFRGGGLASRLMTAVERDLDDDGAAFLYSFPNEHSIGLVSRLGHHRVGRLRRYIKILQVPHRSRLLRAVSRAALRAVGFERVRHRGLAVEWLSPLEALDARVSALSAQVAARQRLSVVRDPAYLAWRLLAHPAERCAIVRATRGLRMTAFAAVAIHDDVALIKDWLAADGESFQAVMAATVGRARAAGCSRLSVAPLESHPDLPGFLRLGFLPRPGGLATLAVRSLGHAAGVEILQARNWYMTPADRDS